MRGEDEDESRRTRRTRLMCSPGLHYFTVVKCAAGLQLGTSWGHPGESDISQVSGEEGGCHLSG